MADLDVLREVLEASRLMLAAEGEARIEKGRLLAELVGIAVVETNVPTVAGVLMNLIQGIGYYSPADAAHDRDYIGDSELDEILVSSISELDAYVGGVEG